MASQPTAAFVLKQIEERGGWDVAVFERVANAETQTAIAQSYGISQGFLSRLIHKDPERIRAFLEAKKLAATLYAEDAMSIADNVPADRDEISKARERISVRRWLASSWDREQYGEVQSDINVNVLNLGEIHLEALRHRIVEAPRPLGLPSETTDTDDDDDGAPALIKKAERLIQPPALRGGRLAFVNGRRPS